MSSDLEKNILAYLRNRPDERFTLEEIMTGTDIHDSWRVEKTLNYLTGSKAVSKVSVMTENGYRFGYRALSENIVKV